MKIAYWDCPTGIAGDMCLGALVHAGVPLSYLQKQLSRLGIDPEYQLWAELVQRNGQSATKIHVDLSDSVPPVRHLKTIAEIIIQAQLPDRAEAWSLAIFRKLAEAEAAVHGSTPEQVHFHEVGATDALIDIVGTCLGLDWLGIEAVYCSPLPTGGGTLRAAHGRLPAPVPAVLQLWQMGKVPIYGNGINRELVTPTGAAIVVTLAKGFGECPPLVLERVGLGAGDATFALPNILRLWIGQSSEDDRSGKRKAISALTHPHKHDRPHEHEHPHEHDHPHSPESDNTQEPDHSHDRETEETIDGLKQTETIVLLQTQLDDLNPQGIGYLFDRLLELGALDVFTQAIGMKKSRPGILLNVLCFPQQIQSCETIIFAETTTLGIRRSFQTRRILDRHIDSVETPYGTVRVKVAWDSQDPLHLSTPAHPLNVQPEYEDCVTIARQQQIPWLQVHQSALRSWHNQFSDS